MYVSDFSVSFFNGTHEKKICLFSEKSPYSDTSMMNQALLEGKTTSKIFFQYTEMKKAHQTKFPIISADCHCGVRHFLHVRRLG